MPDNFSGNAQWLRCWAWAPAFLSSTGMNISALALWKMNMPVDIQPQSKDHKISSFPRFLSSLIKNVKHTKKLYMILKNWKSIFTTFFLNQKPNKLEVAASYLSRCDHGIGILVPWPEIKPTTLALELQSLNHWTTKQVTIAVSIYASWIQCTLHFFCENFEFILISPWLFPRASLQQNS